MTDADLGLDLDRGQLRVSLKTIHGRLAARMLAYSLATEPGREAQARAILDLVGRQE